MLSFTTREATSPVHISGKPFYVGLCKPQLSVFTRSKMNKSAEFGSPHASSAHVVGQTGQANREVRMSCILFSSKRL